MAQQPAAEELAVLHADLQHLGFSLDCGSVVHRHESIRLHTCHISIEEGFKSMQANGAHWIYIARLSTEQGLTCRKSLCVCVCECVLERERSDWGILAVCTELISFSHSFYEAKLMQRYTTPHSRVLLHMIKSLPLSLSLNYLLSFPLVLFLSHWFSLSLLLLSLSHPLFPNPPTAPTSLSDGNLPVV